MPCRSCCSIGNEIEGIEELIHSGNSHDITQSVVFDGEHSLQLVAFTEERKLANLIKILQKKT